MQIMYLLFVVGFSLQAMSLCTIYRHAWDRAVLGNFHGFKNLVTKYNLPIDKVIQSPDGPLSPLILHTVKSIDDIEHSKKMIKFCHTRKSNFAIQTDLHENIVHFAAYFKNVSALLTMKNYSSVQNILYHQSSDGDSPLSLANHPYYDKRPGIEIYRPRIATVAALKKLGYELKKDPLYKKNKLSTDLIDLWYNQGELNKGLELEAAKKKTQQSLKQEIRRIIKDFPIINDIRINNFNGLAGAARYDNTRTIEVSIKFLEIPFKRPMVLHELAHHLLGHVPNENEIDSSLMFNDETFIKQEEEADDFTIKICPEEFIQACQYCIDNNIGSNPFIAYEKRIERAKRYIAIHK